MVGRSIALTFLSALIIGCATSGNFESSSNPDAATLTFFNKSAYPVRLVGFVDSEDCSGGHLSFNGQKNLELGTSTTVSIEPEEKFSFYFYSRKPSLFHFCIVPASFVPQAGARYVATFDLINYSVPFESDALIPGTGLGIPPTDPSLGFTRFQSHNEPLLGTTEKAPCYISVVRFENRGFVREPTFVGHRWRKPVISYSEPQCY